MNERIKELAEQAGYFFYDLTETHERKTIETDSVDEWVTLERFAELVRQDEREKCAADYLEDCARAVEKSVAAEQNRCINIIETYKIPVGGSAAGEIACEMTYAALRDIRDQIRGRTE